MNAPILLVRVCAEIAGISDPGAAARAQGILSRVLEQEGLLVVERDCTQTYRIEHHIGAEQFEVDLIGPTDRATMIVDRDQEPGDVYTQLYHQLQLRTAGPQAERPVVAAAMPAVPDEPADAPPGATAPVTASRSQFYARLGLGGNGASGGGGAFGLGWRGTYGSRGVDLSLGTVAGLVAGKAEFLAFRDKGYLGAGLGFGSAGTVEQNAGVALEGTAGVMLSNRVFAQADLTIPFFSTTEGYPIAIAFSLGLAMGGH